MEQICYAGGVTNVAVFCIDFNNTFNIVMIFYVSKNMFSKIC